MTDTPEPEACMSGWDVEPSEADLLDIARRAYVEHAKAEKGEVMTAWIDGVLCGHSDSQHGVMIAKRAIDMVLAHLANNAPQCAVEALWQATEWDQLEARTAFTAAINAIREAK